MKHINKFFIFALSAVLSACSSNRQPVRPEIVPAVEVKKPATHSLGIIGESEPIYFMPMSMPFQARIDTGAEMSSIDAKNIKKFERDGEKWVSFDLVNRKNGERHHFEKKIKKSSTLNVLTSMKSAMPLKWTSNSAKKSLPACVLRLPTAKNLNTKHLSAVIS